MFNRRLDLTPQQWDKCYWYTLEGRDSDGNPTGGWDLHELRSAQDWYVRYALQSVDGVAEVASVGGFQQEYQVDVDPDAMRAFGVALPEIIRAVRGSNIDVGARTIETNGVEYVIRGRGFIQNIEDIEKTVIVSRDGVPITLNEVATVSLGPTLRRGALDKSGAEAVGGVVVARYGENPMEVIENVKEKINEIAPGLPRKTLEDGTISQVSIVPFYDRTGLIEETLGTLEHALRDEILVTILVVLLLVFHLRSSVLISGLLPLTVLLTFILMKRFGVQANVVALSGIAIAIGTVVDMGIVLCENMLKRLEEAEEGERSIDVLHRAASEVGGAVLTAVATTVISFLPVFTMIGAEGKLFKPLAFTKTFALIASIVITLTVLPPLAHIFLGWRPPKPPKWLRQSWRIVHIFLICVTAIFVTSLLAGTWEPLGAEKTALQNFLFVAVTIFGLLGIFWLFQFFYEPILRWCLRNKLLFLAIPTIVLLLGVSVWLGFSKSFRMDARFISRFAIWKINVVFFSRSWS